MASNAAALASSRIPTITRLPSKTTNFPSQICSTKRSEVAEFSGLRSTGSSLTFRKYVNDSSSFFHALSAQFTPKAAGSATNVKVETVAKLKVAINGFGRIGRNFLRCWHGRKDSPLEVVVVNDSGGVKNASHLLKYDSMLGTFKADVKIVDNETISVDGKLIKVVSSRDPLKLPWAELGIDIVIEGTGVFVDGPGAGKHIQAGAKKVIITAPAKGSDIPTYVVGVNEKDYGHDVANIVRRKWLRSSFSIWPTQPRRRIVAESHEGSAAYARCRVRISNTECHVRYFHRKRTRYGVHRVRRALAENAEDLDRVVFHEKSGATVVQQYQYGWEAEAATVVDDVKNTLPSATEGFVIRQRLQHLIM